WEGQTDGDGRFEWKSAPEGESEFYVYKQGFAQKRGVKAKAGPEDNIIRLSRIRKVIGVVGDAQTGKPIPRFTVMPATGRGENLSSYSDSNRKSYSDPDGHFTLDLDEEEHNVIQVGAEDHLPKIFPLPPAQGEYVTVTVLLEPGEGPAGIVVDPAGNPVPGAEVALVTMKQNTINLQRGRLTSYDAGKIVRSDEQGRFKLLVAADPRRIVATSEMGYGEATPEEFQQTKTVVLLPWGRIEATVLSGGKPASGRSYMLSAQPDGWGEGGSLNVQRDGYEAETDANGKFTIGKIPPGPRGLMRLFPIDGNSRAVSQTIPVDVKPGETTVVTLGGTGATISGRAEATALVSGKEGARINGSLNTPPPKPPQGVKTPEDFQAWAELPETQAAQKSFRSYAAEFKPDGTFSFDGVPPGEYTLTLMATMRKAGGQPGEVIQLGHFERPVSVPDTAQTAVVTLDLGESVLSPPLSPGAIPPAP
ncbi:MAG: carboxypeptidase-like regulatory domain-containing protein, partial [Verrucomicrobiota bacterium]